MIHVEPADFTDVLDPFEVRTGWFRLELVGFQVLPAPDLDVSLADRVQGTIDRLGLDGADHRAQRARDAEYYWDGEVSLNVLREESPFVATELERQDRLRPGDT